MKRKIKRIAALALAAGVITGLCGCSSSFESKTETTGFTTVDGKTEGNASKSSDDNGSASFDISGNHVKMTNFEFDADSALKVEGDIEEDDLVYAQVITRDEDDETIQNIADGHYREDFSEDTVAQQLSDIYRTVFDADDDDFGSETVTREDGVLYIDVELTDGELLMMAKDGSDEYVSIAFSTMDYGTQDIVDAAFEALD